MSSSSTLISISISQNNAANWHVSKDNLSKFVTELSWLLPDNVQPFVGIKTYPSQLKIETSAGGQGGDSSTFITSIIIPLIQQGGIIVTALVGIQIVISKLLEREKDNEVTIEANGKKLTIKGKKIPVAEELIKALFPELSLQHIKSALSKLQTMEQYQKTRDPNATVTLKQELPDEEHSADTDFGY
jgi:hypothetical protein